MKKRINKEIIIMAIISVLFLMMSIVYADYLYNSNQVSFNNNNTTLTSTDVQGAIDELYNKCSNIPAVGTCPEGYECTELNKVTYNANGGSFSGGSTTNDVYYAVNDTQTEETITKYSHTSNIDDTGKKNSNYGNNWTNANITGTDRGSTSQAHVITIEGAESLTVDIYYNGEGTSYDWVSIWSGSHPTYTAYDNYSSTGYVAQKLGGSQSGSYTVNGNSLTSMGHSQYTIEGDTVTFGFRSDAYQVGNGYGYYAIVSATVSSGSREVTKEEGEYSEPTNSNEIPFYGWTENQDGSGIVYKTEEDVKNMLDTENREVVLYAKYLRLICKRATTLHTEQCTNSDTSYFCRADGYARNGIITYGQLGTSGTLTSGDAFDCDVNGDGTYDAETERFYYVSDYYDTSSNSFDSSYATFIYYSNTSSGVASTDNVAWHASDYGGFTSFGPETARDNLPTTSGTNAWREDLLKTRTRNILGGSSPSSLKKIYKSNFSYSGYAARLLTAQELQQGCSITIGNYTDGELSAKCKYLMERTQYTSNETWDTYGPWLETAYDSSKAWTVNSIGRKVGNISTSTSNSYGARPAIEVNKNDISY